jgi:hypothetical protein
MIHCCILLDFLYENLRYVNIRSTSNILVPHNSLFTEIHSTLMLQESNENSQEYFEITDKYDDTESFKVQ